MKNSQHPAKRSQQKNNKPDKNSSGVMRIFYVLMLVLMLSSSLIRIAGASRHPQSVTPAPQVNPASSEGTAARAFVFHSKDTSADACTDLVIPTAGSAVYSNCGAGLEKQYDLSDVEKAQLQSWLAQFQPVNDEHTTGNVSIQLYLNGRGNQVASKTDTQSMVQFAETLAAKIASQP